MSQHEKTIQGYTKSKDGKKWVVTVTDASGAEIRSEYKDEAMADRFIERIQKTAGSAKNPDTVGEKKVAADTVHPTPKNTDGEHQKHVAKDESEDPGEPAYEEDSETKLVEPVRTLEDILNDTELLHDDPRLPLLAAGILKEEPPVQPAQPTKETEKRRNLASDSNKRVGTQEPPPSNSPKATKMQLSGGACRFYCNGEEEKVLEVPVELKVPIQEWLDGHGKGLGNYRFDDKRGVVALVSGGGTFRQEFRMPKK